MNIDFDWDRGLKLDVEYGYLGSSVRAPRHHHPQVVLNDEGTSVLRTLRTELARCDSFLFSVAFVSASAIALLKQELVDFEGDGCIVTSDYLGFNDPTAFAELLNLRQLDVDVRLHTAGAFHPKGYIFNHAQGITAMVGSSNLTKAAIVKNHEWNLKVSAATGSDLSRQFSDLAASQIRDSTPLTQEWIDRYAETYTPPSRGSARRQPLQQPDTSAEPGSGSVDDLADSDGSQAGTHPDLRATPRHGRPPGPRHATRGDRPSQTPVEDAHASPVTAETDFIRPNGMQQVALAAIRAVRDAGERRAIVISATGTGKTILSALEVQDANPRRLLFVVHREQILDRTMREYRRVLGGGESDYGKIAGSVRQTNRKYTFATVQSLSKPEILEGFARDEFDYIVLDEAHRAGAPTHQRLIDYFEPSFLLGMTATPERTDGFNVFELFDYNVPYEIRLSHALEEDMLSPFHYYGIADAVFDDGSTTSDRTNLNQLVSPERIRHLVRALAIYGQAGVPPRGLIFCSRKDEAHALSRALDDETLHGRPLRTVALTGDDTVADRERVVERLEAGEIDYILTVDVFNEGVDIPSINQVVMLRQTKSAIVFVQQLGRGLRKADAKEYLVVIDFIGNYDNNFLIPIALFGDESLNKESLRKNLIAAEESGVLAGLSSVRFDKISQERVLRSIVSTRLDDTQRLKAALVSMRNRVGRVPDLMDFLRFESVDPVLLATKRRHYPELVSQLLKEDLALPDAADRALSLLLHEVLTAKRGHEVVLLKEALAGHDLGLPQIQARFEEAGLPASVRHARSAIDTFTLDEFAEADQKRYGSGIMERVGPESVRLSATVLDAYRDLPVFRHAVDDLIQTASHIVHERFRHDVPFTPARQYSRKEATRLLCWPRKWTSTIYGYRVNAETRSCPIFVTLHKAEDVTASTAYKDELLDVSTMRWYTRSRRTLLSEEVRAIAANEVDLHVFVKKDDADGRDFYYLGQATSADAHATTMSDTNGRPLDVVRMLLHFNEPIDSALFDYFHPTVTEPDG